MAELWCFVKLDVKANCIPSVGEIQYSCASLIDNNILSLFTSSLFIPMLILISVNFWDALYEFIFNFYGCDYQHQYPLVALHWPDTVPCKLAGVLWENSALEEWRSEIFQLLRFHNLQNNYVDFIVWEMASYLIRRNLESIISSLDTPMNHGLQ